MPEPRLLDPRIARALSHPLRRSVLGLLMELPEASPNQIAARLEVPLSTVSYHVHVLRDLECIELVRTVPRRGAVEHFYRATLEPYLDDAQWESLPVAVRRQLTGQTLGELMREMGAAARAGGFDPPGAHIDRIPLRLDSAGWTELSRLLIATLREAACIQERSNTRGEPVEETRPSQLGIVHFVRSDTGSSDNEL